MHKCILPLITFMLIGCSPIKISPEGEQVMLFNTITVLDKKCKLLGPVKGYGSDEKEVMFDLRHNARVVLHADTVAIIRLKPFYQSERMRNYIRRPELTRSRSTHEYQYQNAFSLEAEGAAYLCNKALSTE